MPNPWLSAKKLLRLNKMKYKKCEKVIFLNEICQIIDYVLGKLNRLYNTKSRIFKTATFFKGNSPNHWLNANKVSTYVQYEK